MSTHMVRRHATDERDSATGLKRLIYVVSCSCGWRFQSKSRAARNREADEHKKL